MTPIPIYTFVDNSNIFIEGQKTAAIKKGSVDIGKRYRLDFGKLFEFIAGGRGEIFFARSKDRYYPKLYGSEPPKLDTLWWRLEQMKVDCTVFERTWNKEKRVDAALIRGVSQLIYKYKDDPKGIIALAAGDLDYYDLIFDIQEETGWSVEIYCWRDATAQKIRSLDCYHDLTPHIDEIGFYEKDKFEHLYGDWEDTDWSEKVPYNEKQKMPKSEFSDGKRVNKIGEI